MNLVTYTSLADDEKAKLLLFPFISGSQLAIAAWCRPFTNSQAEILDFMEMCLLSFRFALFSIVAILLIFNPSPPVTFVFAGVLATMLASICAYFAIHVLVQFLRQSAEEMDDTEEEEESQRLETGRRSARVPKTAAKQSRLRKMIRVLAQWLMADYKKVLCRLFISLQLPFGAALSQELPKGCGLRTLFKPEAPRRRRCWALHCLFFRKLMIRSFTSGAMAMHWLMTV